MHNAKTVAASGVLEAAAAHQWRVLAYAAQEDVSQASAGYQEPLCSRGHDAINLTVICYNHRPVVQMN